MLLLLLLLLLLLQLLLLQLLLLLERKPRGTKEDCSMGVDIRLLSDRGIGEPFRWLLSPPIAPPIAPPPMLPQPTPTLLPPPMGWSSEVELTPLPKRSSVLLVVPM